MTRPDVLAIADSHGVSAAQIGLKWIVQKGFPLTTAVWDLKYMRVRALDLAPRSCPLCPLYPLWPHRSLLTRPRWAQQDLDLWSWGNLMEPEIPCWTHTPFSRSSRRMPPSPCDGV